MPLPWVGPELVILIIFIMRLVSAGNGIKPLAPYGSNDCFQISLSAHTASIKASLSRPADQLLCSRGFPYYHHPQTSFSALTLQWRPYYHGPQTSFSARLPSLMAVPSRPKKQPLGPCLSPHLLGPQLADSKTMLPRSKLCSVITMTTIMQMLIGTPT